MIDLRPIPLTAENFAPFGEVIEADHAKSYLINEGTTRRFHALAKADVAAQGGEPILSIFRGTARPLPIEIAMLERHPLGSQAFMPLQCHDWLVVVAEGEKPEAGDCRAFLARGDQGVQYARNVWHHPLLVLQPSQDFLIVDRLGEGDNLEERYFTGGQAKILLP